MENPSWSETMMNLEIFDEQELKQASDCLHDAVFAKDRIAFDPVAKIVSIELWREVWEETTSEKFLFLLHRWKAPHEKCLLSFNQVAECKRDRNDSLTEDQVNVLSFDAVKGEVAISTVTGDVIRLAAEKLEGRLRDLGERTEKGLGKTTIGFYPPLQNRSSRARTAGSDDMMLAREVSSNLPMLPV